MILATFDVYWMLLPAGVCPVDDQTIGAFYDYT